MNDRAPFRPDEQPSVPVESPPSPPPVLDPATAAQPGAAPQRARMGPIARFANVFLSPGSVFEDIRRDPRGWLVPVIICAAVVAAFVGLYFARYDLPVVYKEYLRESFGIKLAGMLGGPEARDKALEQATQQIASAPLWQMQASAITNTLIGFIAVVWFFTFLYGLIALLLGWLPAGTSGKKLFVNLGIVLGIGVAFAVVSGAVQVAAAAAGRAGDDAAAAASPDWAAAVSLLLALTALGGTAWAMQRLAREPAYGRIMTTVSYSLAPSAISAIVGILIVLLRTPDATWIADIVPADLTLLLNLKDSSAVLASLGSSLGLFSLWSLALAILGLATVLGRKTGEAAALVLVPWGLWVLVKLVFAAAF